MDTQDPALTRLIDQVRTARHEKKPLNICGGSSKSFYGGAPQGEDLQLRALAGISSHEPTELVVTARAGTALAELEAALAEHGQCLAFEPPRFHAPGAQGGTVGGMVAAGLAGPARAAVGCVRDYVLGITMVNGRGELLTFGGQVMKNVAGYDLSRLMAGSMGVLGVICEVSLKVLPLPASQATLEFECSEPQALAWFDARRARPLPISATSWHGGCLRVRLSGARAAVDSAARSLGGALLDADEAANWWSELRDQRLAWFDPGAQTLWRLSLPASAPAAALGDTFIEWGGAQRWLRSSASPAQVRAAAQRLGGHATVFRSSDRPAQPFAPLAPPQLRIHRELKKAFDPAGIFNRGRMYPDL